MSVRQRPDYYINQYFTQDTNTKVLSIMSKGLTSKWLKGEATPQVTEHQKKLSVFAF